MIMKIKILLWAPRIIVILAILFMMMFSFDVFNESISAAQKLLALFIHNIPVLILLVLLVVSWKWEMAGGISFMLITIALSIFYRSFSGNPASLIVIGPFFVAGLLFVIHAQMAKRLAN